MKSSVFAFFLVPDLTVGDAAAELGELNAVGFVVHRGQVTAPKC